MIKTTNQRNLMSILYNPNRGMNMLDIMNAEMHYKDTDTIEEITPEKFIDALKRFGKIIDFKYENKGKGHIKLIGYTKNFSYDYHVDLFVNKQQRDLFGLSSIIDRFSYAIIPRRCWNNVV